MCELSTVCLCFPFCSSCVTQKGGPAVCGANEPITDSLSENESDETENIKEKSGDFSEKKHIFSFVTKEIAALFRLLHIQNVWF